jgi:hypothetical protein
MDRIEQDLETALKREPPSAGFADRVSTRMAAGSQPENIWRGSWFRLPQVRWALALLLCAGAIGGFTYRRKEERVRGEAAKQQVYVALRLAGTKMQLAESKVRHLSE